MSCRKRSRTAHRPSAVEENLAVVIRAERNVVNRVRYGIEFLLNRLAVFFGVRVVRRVNRQLLQAGEFLNDLVDAAFGNPEH